MDDKTKRNLRQSARILHRATQVVLLGAIIYTIYGGYQLVHFHFFFRSHALDPTLLERSSIIDADQKRERVSLLPPPGDSTQWSKWAEQVQIAVGCPVSAFVMRNGSVRAVTTRPDHQFALDSLPQRLAGEVEPRKRLKTDTLLSFVRWSGGIHQGTQSAMLAAYMPIGGITGWGILYRAADGTEPFIHQLFDKDQFHNLSLAGKSAAAQIALWEAPGVESVFPAVRVFRGDTLIASSPHVDTTRISNDAMFGGLRYEYYASANMQQRLAKVGTWHFPWLLLVFEIALMIVISTFHRWVKRLTE